MSINFKQKVIQYVINIITSCGENMIELVKIYIYIPGKYKWETLGVIPLIPLAGENHCQPLSHMSKRMIHCYYTDESINQFAIGYMINPWLNCNKILREKFEKWLSVSFHKNKMEKIKDCQRNNNTCVIALMIFYENNGVKQKKCIEL